MMTLPGRPAAGFSLIEMLVAMVILSMTLSALYHAVTRATGNVGVDQNYSYAATIAESLVEEYRTIPAGGLRQEGEFEDYSWTVESLGTVGTDSAAAGDRLYWLRIVVDWGEPGGRQVVLNTVVPSMDDDT